MANHQTRQLRGLTQNRREKVGVDPSVVNGVQCSYHVLDQLHETLYAWAKQGEARAESNPRTFGRPLKTGQGMAQVSGVFNGRHAQLEQLPLALNVARLSATAWSLQKLQGKLDLNIFIRVKNRCNLKSNISQGKEKYLIDITTERRFQVVSAKWGNIPWRVWLV